MRTVTVTGGFSGAAVIDLADSEAQLSGATFSIALTDVGAVVPPPVGDPAWLPLSGSPSEDAATLFLEVDDETEPGSYNAAVDVQRDGKHETVWATDRRGRRALVVVR